MFVPDRLNRIQPWMQGYVDAQKYPGAAVLIHQGGQEVLYADCGLRDVAGGLPWQRDTVARIYSMTKPITSVALMILVERGLVHLDAPVSAFIPAFAEPHCLVPGATDLSQVERCAVPTLHQLLTHTAGLSYSFNPGPLGARMAEEKLDFGPGPKTLAEMADVIAALPLAFPPGARWEYSVGIDIIGRVIEVITGKSLAAFFAEEILGPLGMTETAFQPAAGVGDRFACLYTPLADGAFAMGAAPETADPLRQIDDATASPVHSSAMQSGGGGLTGTIDDYAKFTDMLRAGGKGILSPHTLAFMMRNHLPGDIASMGAASFAEQPMHGMGFGIGGSVVLEPSRTRVPGSVGDFAWGGMASTFFWVDPVHDLSVIFFTQLLPSSSYPSRAQLKAMIHGALQ
ncbi:MAG: serine hydrolase domain-containing protein [Pseudomonadota bacterium]